MRVFTKEHEMQKRHVKTITAKPTSPLIAFKNIHEKNLWASVVILSGIGRADELVVAFRKRVEARKIRRVKFPKEAICA